MVMDHFVESPANSDETRTLRVHMRHIKEDRLHCCPDTDVLQNAMIGARLRELFFAVTYGSLGPQNLSQNSCENFI